MNDFEREIEKFIGAVQFKKIQIPRVGIAGCGGLGSNCAVNLVRSGIKNILIVDFDVVEESNLNRQFYFRRQIGQKKTEALKDNLLSINPDLNIIAACQKLDEDNIALIFSSCQIVVEAFDRAEYKKLLIETLLPTKKFIVAASGLAGYGQSDRIKTHKIKSNLTVIGDLVSQVSPQNPPLSPRVSIAAAKQADAIIEYILSG